MPKVYAAGEMKHGPIALIDKDTKVIALIPKDDHLYYKTRSNLKEIQARGGKIIEITTDENLSENDKNQLIKDNIISYFTKSSFFSITYFRSYCYAAYCLLHSRCSWEQCRSSSKPC